ALARQQVAVLQGGLAEVGQHGVARTVHLDLAHQGELGTWLAAGGDAPDQALANNRCCRCLTHPRQPLHLVPSANHTPKLSGGQRPIGRDREGNFCIGGLVVYTLLTPSRATRDSSREGFTMARPLHLRGVWR